MTTGKARFFKGIAKINVRRWNTYIYWKDDSKSMIVKSKDYEFRIREEDE